MLPNFRSMQGTFVKTYRRVRQAKVTQQAVIDASERGLRTRPRTLSSYYGRNPTD